MSTVWPLVLDPMHSSVMAHACSHRVITYRLILLLSGRNSTIKVQTIDTVTSEAWAYLEKNSGYASPLYTHPPHVCVGMADL